MSVQIENERRFLTLKRAQAHKRVFFLSRARALDIGGANAAGAPAKEHTQNFKSNLIVLEMQTY